MIGVWTIRNVNKLSDTSYISLIKSDAVSCGNGDMECSPDFVLPVKL
jgi:hypothetical protein